MKDLHKTTMTMMLELEPDEKQLMLIQSILKNDCGGIDVRQGSEPFMNERDARIAAGRVSRATFYRWQKRGLISFRVGRRKLFRLSDVNNFIIANKNPGKESKP